MQVKDKVVEAEACRVWVSERVGTPDMGQALFNLLVFCSELNRAETFEKVGG